jgi:cytochrome P450
MPCQAICGRAESARASAWGCQLARLELKVVIEEFLARFDRIRVAERAPVEWQTRGVWAVTRLPLVWG